MTIEENLRKINLLKDFCVQNCITKREWVVLLLQEKFLSFGAPFDIYYENGEITQCFDLTKRPLAFGVKILGTKKVWFAFQPLKDLDMQEAEKQMSELVPLPSQPWRLPDVLELSYFIGAQRGRLHALFEELRMAFGFSKLSEEQKDMLLGSMEKDQIVAFFLNDPYGYFLKNKDEKLCWWPVCDAE